MEAPPNHPKYDKKNVLKPVVSGIHHFKKPPFQVYYTHYMYTYIYLIYGGFPS